MTWQSVQPWKQHDTHADVSCVFYWETMIYITKKKKAPVVLGWTEA